MSEKKPVKKLPSNSYEMLKMKMSLVQSSKKPQTSLVKKENQSTNKNSKMEFEESKGNKELPEPSKSSHPKNPNSPDRSFGDFFCPICDSHMNSDAMWEAHITGKRHIKCASKMIKVLQPLMWPSTGHLRLDFGMPAVHKFMPSGRVKRMSLPTEDTQTESEKQNVKKGDTDSKYEELDGVESDIKYELRNVKDPIIGLSYIHEIRRREPNVPPMYNCFLCHASIATIPLVIEHVISLKHRMNYIKENATEEHELLAGINLKKGSLEPLVHDAASRMEQMHGRGEVKVKQEKPKAPFPAFKRKFTDDDGDDDRKPSKSSELKNSKWKPVGFEKKDYLKMDQSLSPEIYRGRKRSPSSVEDYAMNAFKRSLQNRERQRSPKARERSPRGRELSPRTRERSPRGRERSPRGRERSPRGRDHSPRGRDYSPRGREQSPREREWSPKRDDYYKASRSSSQNDYSRKVNFSRPSSSYDRPEYEPAASFANKTPDKVEKTYPASNYSDIPQAVTSALLSFANIALLSFANKIPNEVEKTYSASNYSDIPQAVTSSYMTGNSVLPHERPMQNNFDFSNTELLKDFVENIFALTNDVFLKIVLRRLESMKLRNVEEMTLLSNIINKAQQLVCDVLPSNIQAVLKQKMDLSSSNSPVRSTPAVEPPSVSSSTRTEMEVKAPNQNLQNLLLEIFRGANGASSTPSVNQKTHAAPVNQFSNVKPSIHINPQILPPQSFQNVLQNSQQPKAPTDYINSSLKNVQPPKSAQNSYQVQTTNYGYSSYKNPEILNTGPLVQSYSYSVPPPSQSSNIPGLTLTEQNNYSGYNQQNYPAQSSTSQNYGYKY